MKVLLINKFLYQKGGAETYVFKLGEILESYGHQVQYFGMENDENIVGNKAGLYVSYMDFGEGVRKNLLAPFRMIYSLEAKKKLLKVLENFKPDVVHMNNIQFHLTPSIIVACEKYRKKHNKNLKVVYTAHDYQLVCPSHGFFDSDYKICEKCLDGKYTHCVKTKCMKHSRVKSILAAADAYFWKFNKAYKYIDTIVCPSEFLKNKLDAQERFSSKTVSLHNFIDYVKVEEIEKKDYVLEFGHLSRDKGTYTLLEAAKNMPEMKFVFAGFGEAVEAINRIPNAQHVGFKTGEELQTLIRQALCSVYPSEWYENCPFSVIESQMYLTPVVGADIGGIPELIRVGETGELFESGNAEDLELKLRKIIDNKETLHKYIENCKNLEIETPDSYYEKLLKIYGA